MIHFTKNDVGVWADGALGDEHLRHRLADMLRSIGYEEKANAILEDGVDADVWGAIDILQAHTEPGLVWVLEAGELILADERQLDLIS